MSINLVVLDGIVKSPALRYATDGKPEFRFTPQQEENGFHLWLPCCAVGSAAERLASELEDGQQIVITSGKLCYRKRQTKMGEQSRLEVLVWSVERLSMLPTREHEPSPEYKP
jgi:single-stranded DNA-binding protein